MKHISNILREYVRTFLEAQEGATGAACVLIVSDDMKVLSVSRKNNPTAYGMPGGKIDPGENAKTAAIRELYEETGLHVRDMKLVYVNTDETGFEVSTFSGKVDGEIDTDETGVIKWVSIEMMSDPVHSPYADYNKKLFSHVGLT